MPWTREQVKYLLSQVSPLSGQQKAKMKRELHADPAMGHMQRHSGFRDTQKAIEKKPSRQRR